MSSMKEDTKKLQRLLERTAAELSDGEREELRNIPTVQDDETITVEVRDETGLLYVTMQPTIRQWKELMKVNRHS